MAKGKKVRAGKEPQTSDSMQNKNVCGNRLNPVAKILLQGLYDENSELCRLQGMWHILKKIWKEVTDFWKANIHISTLQNDDVLEENFPTSKDYFEFLRSNPPARNFSLNSSFINLSLPLSVGRPSSDSYLVRMHPYIYEPVNFPKFKGLQINMMPFIMNVQDFSKCCLPDYLEKYWEKLIRRCPLEKEQIGQVGYLTIHESFVQENSSQRRSGIHTERPGAVRLQLESRGEEDETSPSDAADGANDRDAPGGKHYGDGYSLVRRFSFDWGGGHLKRLQETAVVKDGIYMASNVDDSCEIYNCEIMDDSLIGEHGDIEHLRGYLPPGHVLQGNCIYWLTDRTPHESLPLKKSMRRQFFRLVTSKVSLWYEDHSTKNPLGVEPDSEKTKIVKGSKFDKKGVVIA